jgi:hypothetical protein
VRSQLHEVVSLKFTATSELDANEMQQIKTNERKDGILVGMKSLLINYKTNGLQLNGIDPTTLVSLGVQVRMSR